MRASIIALLLGISYVSSLSWDKEFTLSEFNSMNTHQIFRDWSSSFGRSYDSIENEAKKYIVWLDNLFIISKTNSEGLSYKLRLNQFSDLTSDEFKLYVHGKDGRCFKPNSDFIKNKNGLDISSSSTSSKSSSSSSSSETKQNNVPAPDSVDWTTKGVVTPVKNQGQCGSCWAFSATGAIECDYAITKGTLNSLSEQQLVDCAGARYGCFGCNGGQMTGAMKYAADNGGLCSESEYKYTARNGQCKASSCGTKYDPNKGYNPVKQKSEPDMVTATVSGCVSIGIEADQTAFQHYSSGVLTGNCGTNIDHGVLIVGYGTDGRQDYWKVKNSWGTTWGEKGYVLICRNCNKNNGAGECGILLEGNVPTF